MCNEGTESKSVVALQNKPNAKETRLAEGASKVFIVQAKVILYYVVHGGTVRRGGNFKFSYGDTRGPCVVDADGESIEDISESYEFGQPARGYRLS